jgi:hypothetical protein
VHVTNEVNFYEYDFHKYIIKGDQLQLGCLMNKMVYGLYNRSLLLYKEYLSIKE